MIQLFVGDKERGHNPLNTKRLHIALFASGSGSNAEAIIHYSFRSDALFKVALLVSNNSQCLALQRAMMFGIPTAHLSSATHPEENDFITALLAILQEYSIVMIALAGYMKKIPDSVVEAYTHQSCSRILNIHPALLPKFGGQGMFGINIHKAVIEAGETESGLTIHEVNNEYDSGKIFVQQRVAVLSDDTPEQLAHRINEWECLLYPEAIQAKVQHILNGDC